MSPEYARRRLEGRSELQKITIVFDPQKGLLSSVNSCFLGL